MCVAERVVPGGSSRTRPVSEIVVAGGVYCRSADTLEMVWRVFVFVCRVTANQSVEVVTPQHARSAVLRDGEGSRPLADLRDVSFSSDLMHLLTVWGSAARIAGQEEGEYLDPLDGSTLLCSVSVDATTGAVSGVGSGDGVCAMDVVRDVRSASLNESLGVNCGLGSSVGSADISSKWQEEDDATFHLILSQSHDVSSRNTHRSLHVSFIMHARVCVCLCVYLQSPNCMCVIFLMGLSMIFCSTITITMYGLTFDCT